MRFSSWCRSSQITAVAVLCTAGVLLAQAPAKPADRKLPSPRRLRSRSLSDQQKVGLRQLELAQSEASGLQPDMRAFVLWQASRGYEKIDRLKATSLLRDALAVTQDIASTESDLNQCAEPVFCGPGHWLQEQILRDMIRQSKQLGPIERFLLNADPGFRILLGSALLERYIDEKRFDRAREVSESVSRRSG